MAQENYNDRLIEALRKYHKERRYLTAVSMKCQCWVATRFPLTTHGLRRFGDRRSMIESSQVIEEMIRMAKDMQEAIKRHEELGLNPAEEAFYDALADECSSSP